MMACTPEYVIIISKALVAAGSFSLAAPTSSFSSLISPINQPKTVNFLIFFYCRYKINIINMLFQRLFFYFKMCLINNPVNIAIEKLMKVPIMIYSVFLCSEALAKFPNLNTDFAASRNPIKAI
jgi:hypothetical protein